LLWETREGMVDIALANVATVINKSVYTAGIHKSHASSKCI